MSAIENADTPTWFSTFGRLKLARSEGRITGTYDHAGGALEGTVDGDTLRGTWKEPEHHKAGTFEITFETGGNSFHGRWKYTGDKDWRGPWDGVALEPPTPGGARSLGSWNSQKNGPLLAGPMVGEIGPTFARVWIQSRDESEVTMVVGLPDGGELRSTLTPSVTEWFCASFEIDGLAPATTYPYRIVSALGTTDVARFKTASADTGQRVRVAFGSCYDSYADPLPIFDSIAKESPDVLLLIGDNCYYTEPDWQTEHTMMLAQLRNRNNPTFAKLGANVPTLAVWDDHDFGPNDSDSSFGPRDTSLRVFRRVWSQRAYGLEGVPGIFSSVRHGPIEMFLLDDRYERIEYKQILGRAQLDWLKAKLKASTAPVKLIVSGSQVLPKAAVEKDWECWRRDAPGELEELLAFVANEDIRGVVLISGDVHLGYLLHADGRLNADGTIGPETWELTASPLSNTPWYETILRPGQPYDPYILKEFAVQNYGIVDVDLGRAGEEIHLVLKDPSGVTLVDQAIGLTTLERGSPADRPKIRPAGEPADASAKAGIELTAVLALGDKLHFVKGDRTAIYDLATRTSAGVVDTQSVFPGVGTMPLDAAVIWPNGKAYFFGGSQYLRFDMLSRRVDGGFPLPITRYWRGIFESGIDAGIAWTSSKAFFFRGSEYVRYDIALDMADAGYPLDISSHWPGLWADGVDAAFGPINGKAWFFRGTECIRYDVAADRADAGYPKPFAEEFPGLVLDF